MSKHELHYLLVADGSSDAALQWHINWLLRCHTTAAINAHLPDLGRLPRPPKTLGERVRQAVALSEVCDIAFVHRDAESKTRETRVSEIQEACLGISLPVICVIPVRMLEAWLLFDEVAIRKAAGNPLGRERLSLPMIRTIENVADPKDKLNAALKTASGLGAHRRQNLKISAQVRLVAEWIEDFSPLLAVPAFQSLNEEIAHAIRDNHWG